jgi:hypothetical protein
VKLGISRRGFLQGVAVGAGALATRRASAAAQPGKAAIVSVYLDGGFNALFSSADSFKQAGTFGVTGDSAMTGLGNGLFVDAQTFGTLGAFAKGHMSAIGNRHGSSAHAVAQINNYGDGARCFALQLAGAIGGTAAFKAAAMGTLPPGPTGSENGVSLQLLRTVGDAVTALGLGAPDENLPARNVAAEALQRASAMSGAAVEKSPKSLLPTVDGFSTQVDSLRKPVEPLDVDGILQAYPGRVQANASLNNMNAKFAAAELMIRGGTNVVTMRDTGWDTHGDRNGQTARNMMSQRILPPLKTFLDRVSETPDLKAMNITVIIHGDFARSLPGSDHASGCTALVIGPNVKVGTTGRMSGSVALPPGTGAGKEMWAYLAALAKVPENPFGKSPHDLVL